MDMGTLLRVSAQTIYNWEAEKSRPRQEQLAAIAALRGLGKREAAAKLEELAG
jgi:DNA-binding XRE family transcriptional regulator